MENSWTSVSFEKSGFVGDNERASKKEEEPIYEQ